MTRLHMPAPVIVHALRRDTDLAHQDRRINEARRNADLDFEMWHRGDERILSDLIIGALGQAS